MALQIRAQVHAYMSALVDLGAFESDRIYVQCDAETGKKSKVAHPGVAIMIAFQPRDCSAPVSLTLHQSTAGCRVASTAFGPVIDDCA